jgi:hypothetical protein
VKVDRCQGCGLVIARGADGCQDLFDAFRVREVRELAPDYRSTRLTIDVYCLQHPERFCVSAKSLAAHLTGVAWSIEHDGSERGLQTLQRWLNAPGDLIKPALPPHRGILTIADLDSATNLEDYAARLRGWAESTWAAYGPLHNVARAWIKAAFA